MNEFVFNRRPRLEVARLTPSGRGAVACVGVRGEGAWTLFLKRWRRADGLANSDSFVNWSSTNACRPYFGFFRFEELGDACEEIVLRRRLADAFEIDGHGGELSSSRLIEYFLSHGATLVSGDAWESAVEFEESCVGATERSYGRRGVVDSLFYSAADVLVTQTTTDRCARIACGQRVEWQSFFQCFINDLKNVSNSNDEERLLFSKRFVERIDAVLERFRWGRRLVTPVVVAFLGVPNVGKSSFLNAALGYERAVVSSTKGTTRDLVGASLVVDGWNVRLVDAAGLRDADDELERMGTRLAVQNARDADVVALLYDPTLGRNEQDALFERFLDLKETEVARNVVRLLNKTDLPTDDWNDDWNDANADVFRVSAKTRAGVDAACRLLVNSALGISKLENENLENVPTVWTSEQTSFLRKLRKLCAELAFGEASATIVKR